MCAERGVTGRILKPYFRDLLNAALPDELAGRVTAHVSRLFPILNDPDLKSEAGTIGMAQAGIVQATILPNPVATVGYGALVSGPGTTSSRSSAGIFADAIALTPSRRPAAA